MLKPDQYRALAFEFARYALGAESVDIESDAVVHDAEGGAWVEVLVFVSDEAVVAASKSDDDR